MMQNIKSNTVTDLRKNTVQVLEKVKNSKDPVFILKNSEIAGVIMDYKKYQELAQMVEDYLDIIDSEEAMKGDFVSFEELKKHV